MQPGQTTIADRYELRSLLATGGMGQVWRAHDTLLGRDVALKVLRSEFTGDPSFLARFRAEARHTAVLSHPNIATLFDYGEIRGPEHLAYLVMELVEGESLSQVLAREGRLDASRTAGVLRQTAAGLGAAHALGVVHRDVKPGNVLVARDGTVKLTDFGIASSAASVPLTGTGQIIGTAHYISPEQAQGAPATPASDVYSLGLVGYEMLAGRRAFDGENSVQVVMRHINEPPPPLPADVPEALRHLIDRALDKDPARRFPDGTTFRDAADAVLAGRGLAPAAPPVDGAAPTAVLPPRPASAPATPPMTRVLPVVPPVASTPPAPPPGPPRPARRSRRGLLAAVAALLVFFAVGVVLALSLGGDDPAPGEAGTTTSAPANDAGTSAPQTSTPATTAAEEPPGIEVVADDYVGRPVDDVQEELTALGLTVQLRPVATGEADEGEVLSVDPVGELAPAAVVTVTHAVAPPPPPDEEEDGDDSGPGNGNGNGNGNGGGNGNGNGNGGRDD